MSLHCQCSMTETPHTEQFVTASQSKKKYTGWEKQADLMSFRRSDAGGSSQDRQMWCFNVSQQEMMSRQSCRCDRKVNGVWSEAGASVVGSAGEKFLLMFFIFSHFNKIHTELFLEELRLQS